MDIICCVARPTRQNRIRGSLGGPLLQPDRRLGSSAYPQGLAAPELNGNAAASSSRTRAEVQTDREDPFYSSSDSDVSVSSSDDEGTLDTTPLDRFTAEFRRVASMVPVNLGEPAPNVSSARSSLRTSCPEQPKKLFTVYFADAEGSTTDNENSSDSEEKAAEAAEGKDVHIPLSSMRMQGTPSFNGEVGTPTFQGASDSPKYVGSDHSPKYLGAPTFSGPSDAPTFTGAPTFSGTPTFC